MAATFEADTNADSEGAAPHVEESAERAERGDAAPGAEETVEPTVPVHADTVVLDTGSLTAAGASPSTEAAASGGAAAEGASEQSDVLAGAVVASLLGTTMPGDTPVNSPAEWVLLAAARRDLAGDDDDNKQGVTGLATTGQPIDALAIQPISAPNVASVDPLGTLVAASVKTVGSIVGAAVAVLSHALTNTVTFVNAAIDTGFGLAHAAISAGVQFISGALHMTAGLINYAVSTTIAALVDGFTATPTPLGNLVAGTLDFLGQAVTTAVSLVDNTVTTTLGMTGALITTTIHVLDVAVTGATTLLTRAVTTALDVIAAILNPAATAVGTAPVAANDTVTTAEDTALVIAAGILLANDSDADGDPLTITAATQGAHGRTSLAANGTITYTPAANYHGADTFTYTISDGNNTATATVTVTVTPVNDPPTNGVASPGTPNATTGVVTGTVTAADPDGDTLTYTAPVSTTKGAITMVGNTFTYTPTEAARQAAGADGATAADKQDTFTVTVSDAHGGTLAVAVTVTIAPPPTGDNHAPVVADSPFSVTTDTSTGVLSGTVNVSDPDGDTLTYAVDSTQTAAKLGRIVVDSATGAWVFTPNTNALAAAYANGKTLVAEFTVNVNDGQNTTPVTISAPVSVSTDVLVSLLKRAGSQPSGVAVAADGTVYVINSAANTLSVLGPNATSITSTVHVGASPTAVTVGPDGRVWVANGADGTVVVLNHAGTAINATIKVGSAPMGLAVGADGSVYVTNAADGSVSVIDAATNALSRTIAIGGTPIGIAAGPDGRIYIADFASASVKIIDPTHSDAITTIDNAGANPYGIAVDATGTIYVTQPVAGSVRILTPTADGYTSRTVAVGGNPRAITLGPNGSIYVTDTDAETVTVIDPYAFTTAGLSTATGPNSIAVGLDGKLYLTNGRSDTLTILNPQGSSATTVPVGIDVNTVTVDTHGTLTITSNYEHTTTTVNHATAGTLIAGTTRTGTVTTGTVGANIGNAYFALSPDSRYAYVLDSDRGTVSIVKPADGTVTTITPASGLYSQQLPVFSPDGRYVYIVNNAYAGRGTVSIIDPAAGTATTITLASDFYYTSKVVVSPDSRYAYVSTYNNTGGTATLSIINPAAGTAATFATDDVRNVVVSPDSRYAYVSTITTDGIGTLLVINPATGTATTMATGTHPYNSYSGAVVVSPDSRYAYITNNTDAGQSTVSIINPATGTSTTIALPSGFYSTGEAVVSPDSRYAYVTSTSRDGSESLLTIINPATGTTTTITASAGSQYTYVKFSPDGRYTYAYTSGYVGGAAVSAVSIINPVTGTATATTIRAAAGVPLGTDGRYSLFTEQSASTSQSTVWLIDSTTGTETLVARGYYPQLRITPDGRYAYIAYYNNLSAFYGYTVSDIRVAMVNSAAGTATTISVSNDKQIASLMASPDSRYAYLVTQGERYTTLSIINSATGIAKTITGFVSNGTTTTNAAGQSNYVAASSDGRFALMNIRSNPYTNQVSDDVLLFNPSSGATTTIVGTTALAVSPDGHYIYVVNADGNRSVIDSTKIAFLTSNIAPNDSENTYINRPVTFDPTANPFKPDSGSIITSVSTPTHGTAVFVGSTITYTPDTGYTGIDTFTYTATNGASSATGTITMQVLPAYVPYEAGPTGTEDLYKVLRAAMDGGEYHTLEHGVYTQHVLVNGRESLIVYVSGTNGMFVNQSMLKNADALAHTVDQGQINVIKAAMRDSTEPILLVGFSQGGMDVQNIAANAEKYGLQDQIKAVVTFGAPLVQLDRYPTVHLEENADIVPTASFLTPYNWLAAVVNSVGNQNLYAVSGPNGFNLAMLADVGNLGVHGIKSTYEYVGRSFDSDTSSHWSSVRNALATFLNGQVVPVGYTVVNGNIVELP